MEAVRTSCPDFNHLSSPCGPQMGELERGLVREMASYKRQFEAVRDANSHELESFWLRKTGKAVVAVLVTQKPGEAPVFWRGLNVEVSIPT